MKTYMRKGFTNKLQSMLLLHCNACGETRLCAMEKAAMDLGKPQATVCCCGIKLGVPRSSRPTGQTPVPFDRVSELGRKIPAEARKSRQTTNPEALAQRRKSP